MGLRGPDGSRIAQHKKYLIRHWLLNINNCGTLQPATTESGVLVWNGQIYGLLASERSDRQIFAPGTDDTRVLSELLLSETLTLKSFAAKLETIDGEFSVCVVQHGNVFIANDAFGTKPLSVAEVPGGGIAVATYGEDLMAIGLTPKRVPPGTAMRFGEGVLDVISHSAFNFVATKTHQTEFNLFKQELRAAIRTRCQTPVRVPLIKLSSGVDSGAIAALVAAERLPAVFWTAPIGEDREVIEARSIILRKLGYEVNHIFLTESEFRAEQRFIAKHFPEFAVQAEGMPPNFVEPRLSQIPGYIVGSSILRRGRASGHVSEISGQGIDEIFTDYLGGSGRMASTSGSPVEFRSEWKNFRNGWQQAFLGAGERVAGLHGFETRYPFLAKPFVQAFLDLPIEWRMNPEKAPLKMVLDELEFPYAARKMGFLGY